MEHSLSVFGASSQQNLVLDIDETLSDLVIDSGQTFALVLATEDSIQEYQSYRILVLLYLLLGCGLVVIIICWWNTTIYFRKWVMLNIDHMAILCFFTYFFKGTSTVPVYHKTSLAIPCFHQQFTSSILQYSSNWSKWQPCYLPAILKTSLKHVVDSNSHDDHFAVNRLSCM